jgi:acyl-coenzyme A synthetase/AMP-(fatty) acid ligase
MADLSTPQKIKEFTAEMPWTDRCPEKTVFQRVVKNAMECGDKPALSFQLKSGPTDPAETLTWSDLRGKTAQAANLFRRLGIHEGDVVAYLMPNANETVISYLGALTAGIVCPINPTLSPEHIAGILRETGAKVVITLKPFPKADVAQTTAEAVALAPGVETILEVDLKRYLKPPLAWLIPLLRPKTTTSHGAQVLDFNEELAKEPTTLSFEESEEDRDCAYFHTGGTTGIPKIVRHKQSGTLFNGMTAEEFCVGRDAVILCPLPMFHVFAALPCLMACVSSGAHMVMPTPAGYRGDGVFDNIWKLIERWRVTFLVGVPTAIAAMMQRPVNADVSSLEYTFSGSAPLPVELFNRYQNATGVKILEGYGMSEATCLISGNPPIGERKIGSVGMPFPYTDVRICMCNDDGSVLKDCEVNEIGEICVYNPGVNIGETYVEQAKNIGLFVDEKYMRTGDLGRLDENGYLWITGRAKDLIIRGGHNIDPAIIEEALAAHPDVAMAGAIGQPDAYSGEIPCVYVELVDGAQTSVDALMEHAQSHVEERAAVPKYVEILDELPKTAVGKIFKPDLRKMAITRTYDTALSEAGINTNVASVIDDKHRGLVAQLTPFDGSDDAAITDVLGKFTRPWEWSKG